jgi:hypothetical protein
MKKLFFLTIVCFNSLIYSQKTEFDKKIYVYKTYEDYTNDKFEEKGELDGHEWVIFSGAKIFLKSNNPERAYFKANEIWGFKIDKYLFRAINGEYPVCLIKEKGKYFYAIGTLQLTRIKFDSPKASIQVDGKILFYSDTE